MSLQLTADTGRASAFVLGGEHFGQIFELHLVDYNDDGLGAVVDRPIEVGATISLGFDAPGRLPRQGRVVDCHAVGQHWRIGVCFTAARAA